MCKQETENYEMKLLSPSLLLTEILCASIFLGSLMDSMQGRGCGMHMNIEFVFELVQS